VKPGKPLAGGTGRRKAAVSRVWARQGSGKILINGVDSKEYFDTQSMLFALAQPFKVCPVAATYDFDVAVRGGGKMGQAHAVKLGLSRALLELDESARGVLRQHGLLTVDARRKERKKYGQMGARRGFQFVKR
jgi:small subunit ribosomal protein S9